MGKFYLVDFAAHFQKGFRNHVVPIADVPELVRKFRRFGCYTTYFFYSDEILAYMSAHAVGSTPTLAGYEGKVWAPFFPVDLDHPELEVSLDAARFFVSLLLDRWKVDPDGVQVYFSGSKGFHILTDARIFGKILPSKSLPAIFDTMRRHFAQQFPLELRDTIDLAIKDRLRLLRLPNTMHEQVRLNKVLIFPDELKTANTRKIRDLAREPRSLTLTDETGLIPRTLVKANSEAALFVARIHREVKRFTRRPFRYRFRRPADLSHIAFPCASFQKIWESHVEPGFRNNCAIRLASELRLLGLTEEEGEAKLFEWNEKNAIGLPSQELHSVVRSAYQHPFPYRYSCRDEILRRFCPLSSYESCQDFVERRSQTET
ncbi:MAG: primase C-terminal domain-containing protein [Deltaproteobacteria bacterium]|nr:primase C-terminal domain-containing protein [Deltaproteobacteria bacterium]